MTLTPDATNFLVTLAFETKRFPPDRSMLHTSNPSGVYSGKCGPISSGRLTFSTEQVDLHNIAADINLIVGQQC